MPSKDKSLKTWTTAGFFFLLIFGSALHFFYAWSGNSKLVGLVAPVNESVWEHFKMGYWALVLFAAIEYHFVKNKVNNFFLAKLVGIISLELSIAIVFYSYTAVMGRDMLVFDIGSYVVGAGVCQSLAYRLYIEKPGGRQQEILSLLCLAVIGLAIMILTYYPPDWPIFIPANLGNEQGF